MFGHVYTDIFGPVVVWKDSPRDLFSPTQLREKVSFSFGHQWTFLAPLAPGKARIQYRRRDLWEGLLGECDGKVGPGMDLWMGGGSSVFGDFWRLMWCMRMMQNLWFFDALHVSLLGIYVNIHFVLFDDASIQWVVEADFFWQLNSHEQATCPSFLGGS